jgi:formylglycine-generating enzyme required for sulfatase activity/energy-coupling factor transporter ATP-binding protein EcfA2
MSNTPDQLATLRALRDATADPVQRAALDAAIAALQGPAQAPVVDLRGAQTGDAHLGDVAGRDVRKGTEGGVTLSDDARLNGVAVGVNLGTIIYGRDPTEDERRRLAWYLAGLANRLSRLPLRGLEERLDQGQGVTLAGVYVMLAVRHMYDYVDGTIDTIAPYFENDDVRQPLKQEHHRDYALPTQEVLFWSKPSENQGREIKAHQLDEFGHVEIDPTERIYLFRRFLASEMLHRQEFYPDESHNLVLLGEPGGGKSTFLRHLAWVLALRGVDQPSVATALHGWEDERRLLPILLPLRTLAGRIVVAGAKEATVFAALRDEMHACCVLQVDDLLSAALNQGTALLLCDGLDEVPLQASAASAGRAQMLDVLRAFAAMYPKVQVVVTCRTRAFGDELRARLGWPVETIDAFSLGQVRHFVPAWYGELVARGQITQDQAERLSASLLGSITTSPKLTEMARTPLLLTMMALVLFNKGELPRDRPQLYERILDLLLGQWDKVREGASLSEAIGLPDWDSTRFQPLLDQLSYQAHLAGSSTDGRGRLARGELYMALIDFFKAAQVPSPGDAALAWLDYVEQRSGLLAPDGADSYVFAHLTLQEHCAGRHIALNSENPVALAMSHRADDRWREPLFLGAGLMPPAVLNSLLADLIDGDGKERSRWYRDLILAAELGQDRDWSYLRTRPMVKVDRLQRDLRAGLVALLADKTQPFPAAERVRAGFLLGDLGDPRFPVTIDDWRRELAWAGEPGAYFCRVEPGEYFIGSADDDPDAQDIEKPRHIVTLAQPLYIARYPITNAQWQLWIEQGGEKALYSARDANLKHPNQPVVSISWHMANGFCVWLSEQVGTEIRLPTEQEWEAAARGGDGRCYPWGDGWREDHAATLEDREVRGTRWSVPVGCYPAGAAPCGALDIAGNVWEWTASAWQSYPGAEKAFTKKDYREDYRIVRGGSYNNDRTYVRCGTRGRDLSENFLYTMWGFRVCVSPSPHKDPDL